MPDRDVFQRSFRGSGPLGWQAIARLLNYDPNRVDIDQRITKSLAKTLRLLPPTFVRNVFCHLEWAIFEQQRRLSTRNSNDAFLNLCYNLRVENGGNAFEISESIKKAAKSCFLKYRGRSLSSTDSAISDGFADSLAERLIDTQLFSKIRDEFMKNSGRSFSGEDSWERGIIDRNLQDFRTMIRRYLDMEGREFRALSNRRTQRKSTSQLLKELIPSMPVKVQSQDVR